MIINPQFEKAESFAGELAKIKSGDNYSYMDRTGKTVWEPAKK